MKLNPLGAAAIAACLAIAAGGARADTTLLAEGFDNVSALSGWVLVNNSTAGGLVSNFYQGEAGVFSAQAGAANAYIAGNYNLAPAGGLIDAWLITPTFATDSAVTISFYLRADAVSGFFDTVNWGTSTGSSAPGSFTLGSSITVPTGGWTQYTVNLAAAGAGSVGRFAIHYTGNADDSNYLGIDSVSISAVPEPASALLLVAGLAGVGALRRRARG